MTDTITTLADLATAPPTVSVRDASKALGISPSHGYNLCAHGEFPARVIKLGSRRYRVVTASLVALLSEADGGAVA